MALPIPPSSNPEVDEFLAGINQDDKLGYYDLHIGTYFYMSEEQEKLMQAADEILDPILIMIGSNDTNVDNDAALKFYDLVGSKDKFLKDFEGTDHF